MRSRRATALQQLPVLARPRRRRVRVSNRTTPRVDGARTRRPWRTPHILTMTMRVVPRTSTMEEVRVPCLRMSGRWLVAHGFRIGAPVYVTVEQGRVILTNTSPADDGIRAELRVLCAGINARASLSFARCARESAPASLFSHLEDSESDRRSL